MVYGNGLPYPPEGGAGEAPQKEGGYLQGCFPAHSGEGIDVRYAREILAQVQGVLKVDRPRVYAAGLSAGGGMAFELASRLLTWWPPSRPWRLCLSGRTASG